MRVPWLCSLLMLVQMLTLGCGSPVGAADAGGLTQDAGPDVDAGVIEPRTDAGTLPPDAGVSDAGVPDPPLPVPPLEIEYLGVAGFLLRVGADAILTAPFFTNPDLSAITIGDVSSDPALVQRYLDEDKLAGVRAILVGHAHYDHLMDVPEVWRMTEGATIYGNRSVAHLLRAYDPPSTCVDAAPPVIIPQELVVAVDAEGDDRVDTRNCAGVESCRGVLTPQAGEWIPVPNANVRIMAFCSAHPAQFGPIHFGNGCMDEDQCEPPRDAYGWREGDTIAWLIDFLNDSGAPIHRVYFQDAPADPPLGFVPPDVLESKSVDAALLCVGTYDQVQNHPAAIVENLSPRYAIGGHWESFFRTRERPLVPIPFMDMEPFEVALENAAPPDPAIDDGAQRALIPDPGAAFTFAPAP